MKVPNQYRIGQAIKFGETTNDPRIKAASIYNSTDDEGNNGAFVLPKQGSKVGFYFFIIASSGMDWEHVSVSIIPQMRCPTWEEMCYIKSFFWEDEEAVMQLHPPKSEWVNNHPYCLHLWRPILKEIPLPPKGMVGLQRMNTKKNLT